MWPAPRLVDEQERLAALRRLQVLGTPPEERFDLPNAVVSLVDGHRQWFKSCVGLDAPETARDMSFCGHAIAEDDVLVVHDAVADPRFADTPLAAGPPFIRFDAGAPLTLPDGYRLGTLCLIATEPRRCDDVDRAIHQALRDLVLEELLRQEEHS